MTIETTADEKRTKLLQRVLNLRARAEDSGASEAEMNTAFNMASKLMDSYNIEEAELALAEASGEIKLDIVTKESSVSVKKGKKQMHKVLDCLNAIATFTETKVVYSRWAGTASFTGHKPDVELSDFLMAVIKEALDREYAKYRASMPAVGYGAKASFQNAMVRRISSRLYDMASERNDEREKNKQAALQIEQATTASSTALVVSEIAEQKKLEVETEFQKAYPNIRTTTRTLSRSKNLTAHGAGREAGNRVNLGRAITQGSTKKITS